MRALDDQAGLVRRALALAGSAAAPLDFLEIAIEGTESDTRSAAAVLAEMGASALATVGGMGARTTGSPGSRNVAFEGGTFSVSNLGPYGIEGFTPIINLPQVAILGVGAARRVAVIEDDGAVGSGYEMVLSLTFDHAFVVGAPAAAFLRQLRETLEH